METLARLAWLKLRPGARRVRIFLVQGPRKHPARFQHELAMLFQWLAAGEIEPQIHVVLPLKEVRTAQEMLERGEVNGKIILQP